MDGGTGEVWYSKDEGVSLEYLTREVSSLNGKRFRTCESLAPSQDHANDEAKLQVHIRPTGTNDPQPSTSSDHPDSALEVSDMFAGRE